MNVLTEPHPGPWTEEEFLALAEELRNRAELFDGCLLLNPIPAGGHQQLARRLANLLEEVAPPDLAVFSSVNLRVVPLSVFVPDVAATRQREDLAVYDAEHVVLVAEVVTPYGGGQEKLLKHEMYAEAGIPRYVMVEADEDDEPTVSLHVLRGAAYIEAGRARPGQVLRIDEPQLDLDPADLLRR